MAGPDNAPAPALPDTSPAALRRLVACEYCDAVYERTPISPGERALCLRCGGELYRESRRHYRRLLPLVIAALILFLVSNAYPIVEMDLKGVRTQTTLLGAVHALYDDQMALVAALVFATTILFPLSELLMMMYLLVPMAQHRMPVGFDRIVRGIRQTRPWGMIEVFMIGVTFLAVTPRYPWYALLLIPFVVLSGRWEWMALNLAIALRGVWPSAPAFRWWLLAAVLVILVVTLVRTRREDWLRWGRRLDPRRPLSVARGQQSRPPARDTQGPGVGDGR